MTSPLVSKDMSFYLPYLLRVTVHLISSPLVLNIAISTLTRQTEIHSRPLIFEVGKEKSKDPQMYLFITISDTRLIPTPRLGVRDLL